MTKMMMPPTQAVLAAIMSPAKPRAQGEINKSTAQIRLIQSWMLLPPRHEDSIAMQTSIR